MNKPSLLPEGVVLEGSLEGSGDFVVRGRIEGPIHIDGTLLIDESGLVRGHVHARSVTIRGVLKGNAFGDESVRIDASARVVGDVTAPRVRVVRGARFRGQVHMGEAGDPVLAKYDASQHTFTGVPAPTPEPATREMQARTPDWETLVGAAAPVSVKLQEVEPPPKTLPGRPAAMSESDGSRNYGETIPAPPPEADESDSNLPEDSKHDTEPPTEERFDTEMPQASAASHPMTIPAPPPVPSKRRRTGTPSRHMPVFGRISAKRRVR